MKYKDLRTLNIEGIRKPEKQSWIGSSKRKGISEEKIDKIQVNYVINNILPRLIA